MFEFNCEHIEEFNKKGYLIIPRALSGEQLLNLRQVITDIMQGARVKQGRSFQLDPASDAAIKFQDPQPIFMGPSDDYRKVKDLEYDHDFLTFFQSQFIRDITREFISEEVSIMRAMLVNKPTNNRSSPIRYHQDISDKWPMTAPPKLTFWFPLDDVSKDNGGLSVFPGSHSEGRIGDGHVLSEDDLARLYAQYPLDEIVLKAGDGIVFDCALVHGSGINITSMKRRAITLCVMDAVIKNLKNNTFYPKLFGQDCLMPEKVAACSEVPVA